MDTDADQALDVSVLGRHTDQQEAESHNLEILERVASDGEGVQNLRELLSGFPLDLAFCSEKLGNLNVLLMKVAARESELEACISMKDNLFIDSGERVLEFDLLMGILDSEVKELDKFMANIQFEIVDAVKQLSSSGHSDKTSTQMEEMINDIESSLQQLRDQASEIKVQSAMFQTTLYLLEKENRSEEDSQLVNMDTKANLQTAEEQKDFLRMLDKSLEREIDLENKLNESVHIEEELKLRLQSSEHTVLSLEEEVMEVLGRYFEADLTAESLMGGSKELLGRLQILQFNLNGLLKRECELKSKFEDFIKQQKEQEISLTLANSEALTLREKVSSLEKQLKDSEFQLSNVKASRDGSPTQQHALGTEVKKMENEITDLREKLIIAESKVEIAEAKCKLLTDKNMKLNEELVLLNSSGEAAKKVVDELEKELKESDLRLQQAVASADASQEKESMLYSTIADMENLIKDLKTKVSKEESRADSAEDKCILISESCAELNEELHFLRSRLGFLEASLHQAEKLKLATAKDIGVQTKFISNLVMQLAVERERLHKQISSLAFENKVLAVMLKQANKDSCLVIDDDNPLPFSNEDSAKATCDREVGEGATELSATDSKLEEMPGKNASVGETQVEPADLASEPETERRIDAGILSFRHVFLLVLISLISAGVYLFIGQE